MCVYASALTFPVDLTPFQMQKKHITHTARRHRARSHFRGPMSSIPVEMLRTLRLQRIHGHRKRLTAVETEELILFIFQNTPKEISHMTSLDYDLVKMKIKAEI